MEIELRNDGNKNKYLQNSNSNSEIKTFTEKRQMCAHIFKWLTFFERTLNRALLNAYLTSKERDSKHISKLINNYTHGYFRLQLPVYHSNVHVF